MKIRLGIIVSCLLTCACYSMASTPVYHLAIACENSATTRTLGVSTETMPLTVKALIEAQASCILLNTELARNALAYITMPMTNTYALVTHSAETPQIIGVLSIPSAYLSAALTCMGFNDLPRVTHISTEHPATYLLACIPENRSEWEPLLASAPDTPLAHTMRMLFHQTTPADHAWNIIHIGHGAPSDSVTHIGGISAEQMRDLMTCFEPIHAQLISLVSCFSGNPATQAWLEEIIPPSRHFALVTLTSEPGTVRLPYLQDITHMQRFFIACAHWICMDKTLTTAATPQALMALFGESNETRQLKKTIRELTTNGSTLLTADAHIFKHLDDAKCAVKKDGSRDWSKIATPFHHC